MANIKGRQSPWQGHCPVEGKSCWLTAGRQEGRARTSIFAVTGTRERAVIWEGERGKAWALTVSVVHLSAVLVPTLGLASPGSIHVRGPINPLPPLVLQWRRWGDVPWASPPAHSQDALLRALEGNSVHFKPWESPEMHGREKQKSLHATTERKTLVIF